MKKLLISLLFVVIASSANAKPVHVNGYTRKDGTYVAPHYRTAPNNTNSDNWGTRGNTNPYTGKNGTINPDGKEGSGIHFPSSIDQSDPSSPSSKNPKEQTLEELYSERCAVLIDNTNPENSDIDFYCPTNALNCPLLDNRGIYRKDCPQNAAQIKAKLTHEDFEKKYPLPYIPVVNFDKKEEDKIIQFPRLKYSEMNDLCKKIVDNGGYDPSLLNDCRKK
jgi:hypothetical protein